MNVQDEWQAMRLRMLEHQLKTQERMLKAINAVISLMPVPDADEIELQKVHREFFEAREELG